MFAFGNLGNTCYMNTALQCLMRLPALNSLLDAWENPGETPVQQLVKEYDDLRVMATTNDNCFIKPGRFKQAVQIFARQKGLTEFISNNQQDAVEFILFMLNCIHDAMSRPIEIPDDPSDDAVTKQCRDMMRAQFAKTYSEIVDLFYGVHVSSINERSHTPEVFLTVELPIPPGATTLTECIGAYTASDAIVWLNEQTGLVEPAAKQIHLKVLPRILICVLKRFNQQDQKNAAAIDIPERLDVNSVQYELRCAVLHQGGTHAGHYAACARVHDAWTVLDDDTSYPLDTLKQTYCAIYEKIKI